MAKLFANNSNNNNNGKKEKERKNFASDGEKD